MTDGNDAGANKELKPFESIYLTIVDSLPKLSPIAAMGAAHTLLVAGLVGLAAAITLKVATILSTTLVNRSGFTTTDFGILVSGAIALLMLGSALRVWDKYLIYKAEQRDVSAKLEAADKTATFLDSAAAKVATNYAAVASVRSHPQPPPT